MPSVVRGPARPLLLLLATGLGAACGLGDRGTVIFPPGGLALDSTGRQERVLVRDTLLRLRSVGGRSDQDTTFINPYIMTGDGNRLYLVETDNRILCLDTLGAVRWTQGKEGGGPGEYRNPRDLKVGPDGRLWVLDPASGRITTLDRGTGKVTAMIRMRLAYSPMIVPLRDRFALFSPDPPADISWFTATGDTLRADSLPWSGYHEIEPLSRQFRTALDPRTGRWVFAFIYGNGWFAFDSTGKGSERRYYVEPTRFPPVLRQVRGDAVATSLIRVPGSALDVQLAGDTVFVLFDGQAPDRRQKVDMYSWESGKYFGSFLLPEPADNIAVSGSLLSVYASNPVPKLTFYRRQAKPAADGVGGRSSR